jgi:microsomal epoxide hydrolase
VTQTITSSARLYYETRQQGRAANPSGYVAVPTGMAVFPGEVTKLPRRWVEQDYNITHWREQPRGGHFAAMEVPDVYVDEIRTFFRTVR